jgi:hypothetical protein
MVRMFSRGREIHPPNEWKRAFYDLPGDAILARPPVKGAGFVVCNGCGANADVGFVVRCEACGKPSHFPKLILFWSCNRCGGWEHASAQFKTHTLAKHGKEKLPTAPAPETFQKYLAYGPSNP